MSAPIGSTDRKRLCGEACWRCERLLPEPAPGYERACIDCAPHRHTLTAHVQRHGYSVTFSTREPDGRHSLKVGPWLILASEDAILRLLNRGNPSATQMEEYDRTMRAWGVGTVDLHLSDRQYIRLLEAGIRDTRTGYDKLKARETRV
jgi:hypothetical protein